MYFFLRSADLRLFFYIVKIMAIYFKFVNLSPQLLHFQKSINNNYLLVDIVQ